MWGDLLPLLRWVDSQTVLILISCELLPHGFMPPSPRPPPPPRVAGGGGGGGWGGVDPKQMPPPIPCCHILSLSQSQTFL